MRYNTYPAFHIRGINVFTTRAHAFPIADYGQAAKCSELPRETPSYDRAWTYYYGGGVRVISTHPRERLVTTASRRISRSETREEAKERKKVSESEKEREGEKGRKRGGREGGREGEREAKAVLCVTRRTRVGGGGKREDVGRGPVPDILVFAKCRGIPESRDLDFR
ncbi:hypothetical protein ALC53_11522 [Atta colombica]|uniref:Uncharacterized protein n=1 Tax=Atta colombica TaxID=520822 RepID=A0A195B188_9HYME|nr:hypothetical protein ALC53_11522 [Atta colombica]